MRSARRPESGISAPGRLAAPALQAIGRRPTIAWFDDIEFSWQPEGRTPSFERSTVPAPQGERGDDPLDLRLIIDGSPSEEAADPHGHRMVAARRILHLLQHELKCKADTMAVIHFSEVPRPVLGPTSPHSKVGRRVLRQMLRNVGGGSGTDIRRALDAAASLRVKHRDASQVVVLLTDGQDGSSADQLAAAIGRFQPGAVHVISIGQELPPVWQGLALGSTRVIDSMARPDAVEWTVAHAVYEALGLGWSGPTAPPST